MIDASWVIVDRTSGEAVMETYNFELCQFINLKRYRVLTIYTWLVSLNREKQKNKCIASPIA